MATITTSQTISSATPYTLAVGNTISLTAFPSNYRVGEAIYTSFSSSTPTNPTGGATIVIDGNIIDNSTHPGFKTANNIDEYAVQSRANQQATIENAGVILSPNLIAIGINDGLVYNSLNSTISGYGGIRIGVGSFGSTIINQGEVFGSKYAGINFLTPGGPLAEITNASSGLIRGGTVGTAIDETGIFVQGGFVTITNAGSIDKGGAAGYSVDIAGTQGHNQLILDPGQVLNGVAKATGVDNYITLAGTTLGTLSNPGNYIGWTLASVAKGADWEIGSIGTTETFSGIPTINDGGFLDLNGTVVSSAGSGTTPTTVNMEGNGAGSVLEFNGTAFPYNGGFPTDIGLPNPVTDFGLTDSIILGGFSLTGDQEIVYDYENGTLAVTAFNPDNSTDGSSYVLKVSGPNGNLTNSAGVAANGVQTGQFTFTTLAGGGLLITDNPCFASGTRILTPDGEVAVESLAVGSQVLTVRDGHERAAEIIWVGQRTVDISRHAMPEKVRPVRILAGAFGPGLPQRDLRVSPDHALYIDGHLIEAKTLVNGVTVIVETATRFVTYHHIELAAHDVVLAEGLAAESYLESGNRAMFENDAQPMVLHPDFAAECRTKACAPLLTEGDIVTAVRQRLLERAIKLGFAITGEIDATVQAGAKRITPSIEGNTLRFNLPANCATATLLCSAGIPAELGADPGDRRSLGLAVTSLALIDQNGKHAIALDDNHEGFHTAEPTHRWTTGNAKIALPAYTGTATLEITTNGQAARWATKTSQRAVA
jgi:hypothetical protein